ncbi:MAG: YqiA/YcfP family alpha/beta fold hydrolase [Betaproteobacteria bacterium]
MDSTRTIVYLHGFRSSPASVKATRLREYVETLPQPNRPALHIPELAHGPAAAVRAVADWVDRHADPRAVAFIGSSLGGFYATHFAERYDARAVLINPAIRPYEALLPWRGTQTNMYSGASFEVTDEHFGELRALAVSRLTRLERYFLLVETGDDVLDYREAVAFYAGAYQYVHGGGEHAFTQFVDQLPAILRFTGVEIAQ